MDQDLYGRADEHDDVAPKDGFLWVVMYIDGCIAVYRQTRNARRRFAILLKHPDFSDHFDGVLVIFVHNHGGRWCDRQLIVKFNRVHIVARRNARVLQAKEVVMSDRVRAVSADDLFTRVTSNIDTLIQYKIHVLCCRISQINVTTLMFASLRCCCLLTRECPSTPRQSSAVCNRALNVYQ
jgi:hypothetical protein